jgi:Flp pilus assembly pilin Flp
MIKLLVSTENRIKSALQDRKGVTALEYGIVASVIIAALAGAFTLFTNGLSTAFTALAGSISSGF